MNRFRVWILIGVLSAILPLWLARLWQLQVFQGAHYTRMSQGNRVRAVPLVGLRGLIQDRQGRLLAYNRPAFNLHFIREDTPDITETLRQLAAISGRTVAEYEQILRKRVDVPPFRSIMLERDVGAQLAAKVDTYLDLLPGMSVVVEPRRFYPAGKETAHLLGYVNEITEAQRQELAPIQRHSGRIAGTSGVERSLNTILTGIDGGKQVEVDHLGRELQTLAPPIAPQSGRTVQLAIDLELQRHAYSLLEGYQGVILVSRPDTGEVLAMVSRPSYDPNLFAGGIRPESWEQLTQDETRPLLNRAMHGVYPPGSVFKMVIALAGLEAGMIQADTKLNCPGSLRLGRERRYCWLRSGHGEVNLAQAIARSCNVFFYQLGLMLGIDEIHFYASALGFGKNSQLVLDGVTEGLLPHAAWKQKQFKQPWYDGDTLSVAIGQGYLSVTPVQLLGYINILANQGVRVPLTLRRGFSSDAARSVPPEQMPGAYKLPMRQEHWAQIHEGLRMAVQPRGTAVRARSRLFSVAGKTGTAQLVGRRSHEKTRTFEEMQKYELPHSLFLGYAPVDQPRVSVVVIVEHGLQGGRVAAPLGRSALEFALKHVLPPLAEDTPAGSPADAASPKTLNHAALVSPAGAVPLGERLP